MFNLFGWMKGKEYKREEKKRRTTEEVKEEQVQDIYQGGRENKS